MSINVILKYICYKKSDKNKMSVLLVQVAIERRFTETKKY